MADFKNIPSQFDEIPEGHPVVFISYSWDSEEHKAWVKKLSDDLRSKYAVYTLLDRYNRGGFDLITFMTKAVERADRVLLIGTPDYRKKSEEYDGGGAKYEDQLISIQLYHQMGSSKFIPVLRTGKFDTAFSPLIETRTGYDMREESDYEGVLEQLAADLWNNPINAAPALGPKPSFASKGETRSQIAKVKQEMTSEQFVTEIKRLLSTPNSEIAYTEMIEDEAQKAYEKIQLHADYNFSITSESFKAYLDHHIKAVEKLIETSIVIVRYGTMKQQELLVNALVKLCMKPFKDGEISVVGTSSLHLLGATFLFHAIGISCVKYGYYQILPLMMKKKVPAGHALSPSYPYPLGHLAGASHWQPDTLNLYMESGWLYPYSELLSRNLKLYFKDYCLNEDDYKDCFAIWEHLFSLMYVYYNCSIVHGQAVFPNGLFLSKRIMRNSLVGCDTYSEFFAHAKTEKNEWVPLKQGLFDGSYMNFMEIYNKAEAFYQGNRR